MQGLIYGIICLVLGILGFMHWWGDFLRIIKGVVPIVLIVAGLVALSTGVSMVRESHASEGEDTPAAKDEEE